MWTNLIYFYLSTKLNGGCLWIHPWTWDAIDSSNSYIKRLNKIAFIYSISRKTRCERFHVNKSDEKKICYLKLLMYPREVKKRVQFQMRFSRSLVFSVFSYLGCWIIPLIVLRHKIIRCHNLNFFQSVFNNFYYYFFCVLKFGCFYKNSLSLSSSLFLNHLMIFYYDFHFHPTKL